MSYRRTSDSVEKTYYAAVAEKIPLYTTRTRSERYNSWTTAPSLILRGNTETGSDSNRETRHADAPANCGWLLVYKHFWNPRLREWPSR
ncbi:unnamed protein product [Acanthoscelides obtectus]|uniref:Uncharacterized protein n=1 Tax=Acanthoscelides obtectus TaxID=200917 RepID=A0A9P0PTK1_ACAOB|nr:unnamed protein product [Acanthoscelides obtectus]CAK1680259.1 hypothetical protein AOBTE_LOCUS32551 [Acanthoscelides obtectus]